MTGIQKRMHREYLDNNIWVIKNFLSKEEIDTIMSESIKNNGLSFDEGGWIFKDESITRKTNSIQIKVLREESPRRLLEKENGIFDRIQKEFLEYGNYKKNYTLQKIVPCQSDLGLSFHAEQSNGNNKSMTAGIIIYLNDNFGGGELVFKNKNITVLPESGMLICIPPTVEYEHAVKNVTYGERHTLYGHVWENVDNAPSNVPEDYRVK